MTQVAHGCKEKGSALWCLRSACISCMTSATHCVLLKLSVWFSSYNTCLQKLTPAPHNVLSKTREKLHGFQLCIHAQSFLSAQLHSEMLGLRRSGRNLFQDLLAEQMRPANPVRSGYPAQSMQVSLSSRLHCTLSCSCKIGAPQANSWPPLPVRSQAATCCHPHGDAFFRCVATRHFRGEPS